MRVFDGKGYDWLMQNYVSYLTEQQEESGVLKADVCAGVETSGRRLEAVCHRAACGGWRGRGRRGAHRPTRPLIGQSESPGFGPQEARAGATSTQPTKLLRPVYRSPILAESCEALGRAVC